MGRLNLIAKQGNLREKKAEQPNLFLQRAKIGVHYSYYVKRAS